MSELPAGLVIPDRAGDFSPFCIGEVEAIVLVEQRSSAEQLSPEADICDTFVPMGGPGFCEASPGDVVYDIIFCSDVLFSSSSSSSSSIKSFSDLMSLSVSYFMPSGKQPGARGDSPGS